MDDDRRSPRRRRVRSIEGVRAIAVSAVVAYHAGATWLPGGFLGVDVFFVVSGYLIAAGLLKEWETTEAIQLAAFYRRRARRLLPALALLLVTTSLVALAEAPDAVPRLRGDLLAALIYTSNWWQIVAGQSYFEVLGRAPLLRHLWSLAVEEQFYLLFPLAFGPALRRVRSREWLFAGVVALAVLSTVWMAMLWSPGDDPSRVYFGSDTRLAGLLVGVATAVLAGRRSLRTLPRRVSKLASAGGAAVLAAAALGTTDTSPWLYDHGGFLVVAVAAACFVVGTAHQRSVTGRILGSRPMRWLGTRSYGVYLWHWPVQELTRSSVDVPWHGPGLVVGRIVLIGVLAELSWRFVEQPVRFGRLAAWWRARRVDERRLRVGLALGAVAALAMAMATADGPERQWWETDPQIVSAMGPSSAPLVGAATRPKAEPALVAATAPPSDAIDAHPPPESPGASSVPQPGRPRAPRPTPQPASVETTEAMPPPLPPPLPPLPPDLAALAVGDSVMVAARNALFAEGGSGTRVDAVVGRQNEATLSALERYRDDGTLALTERLIVHIGTNGPLTQAQFDRLVRITAEVPDVVVVNVRVPKTWEAQSNQVIGDNVGAVERMRLADWHEASGHPGILGSDGVHPTPSGARVYARLALAPRPEPQPAPPPPAPPEPEPAATTTTTEPPPAPPESSPPA
ncbi:MAG TPA: acyltransferase family protein [Acidimicrobiales bacterium]|nr:acyltransferase family protein [Acidimicrobiales bacterium]